MLRETRGSNGNKNPNGWEDIDALIPPETYPENLIGMVRMPYIIPALLSRLTAG